MNETSIAQRVVQAQQIGIGIHIERMKADMVYLRSGKVKEKQPELTDAQIDNELCNLAMRLDILADQFFCLGYALAHLARIDTRIITPV